MFKTIDAICSILFLTCVIEGVIGIFKGGNIQVAVGIIFAGMELWNVNVLFGKKVEKMKEKIIKVLK